MHKGEELTASSFSRQKRVRRSKTTNLGRMFRLALTCGRFTRRSPLMAHTLQIR